MSTPTTSIPNAGDGHEAALTRRGFLTSAVATAAASATFAGAAHAQSTLGQATPVGNAQRYSTGVDLFDVLQMSGTWFEMGRQYGAYAKDRVDPMVKGFMEPTLKQHVVPMDEALRRFGSRVLKSCSHRRQEFFRGYAQAMGWPVERVVLLDQIGVLGFYQGKIHSFSGCTSLYTWGGHTPSGHTVVGRNMDWGEIFREFPVVLAVFNPTDGSNKVANLNWVGWTWIATGLNHKGVYADLHDGTSMGGSVVSTARPSAIHSMFDWLAECDSSDAVGIRFNATKSDVPFIWGVGDASGDCFSYETPLHDSRRRDAQRGDEFLVVVNSFLNPDWGLEVRDTLSNSLTRHKNMRARAAEARGTFDTAKMRQVYDLPLFNEDGTFRKNGGATKPTKLDADLTNWQNVVDLNTLETWIKLPTLSDWIDVDMPKLFAP